jgi:DNA-binding beta-propeller fold protein YncE
MGRSGAEAGGNKARGKHMKARLFLTAALLGLLPAVTQAQIIVAGNDEKVWWDDSGKPINQPPGKDTLSFIDIKDRLNPKILASIQLENSIFGPPTNLAVSPKGDIAIVANSVTQTKDGDNWKPVPDNKLYVFDLTQNPPKQIGSLEGGKQPSGLSISRKGNLALVTNRADNSISVLAISGKDVKVVDTVQMGDSVAHVAITPDGTKALAIKPVVNKVALLKIDGQKVTYDKYDMPVGIFPYNIDVTPNGKLALVANNGAGGGSDGNVDTVSVIDLEQNPPRVINHVVVGDAPEGFAISPKGDLAIVLLLRGSNSDKKAFFYHKTGAAVVLKIDGKKVTKASSEIELGGLPEGIAFAPDGKHVYVGNFMDSDVSILKVADGKVTNTGKKLKLPGHPASMRGMPN